VRLRTALPGDVEVLTRRETLQREVHRWVYDTNYGLIFQSGVCVAVIVGTAIVYQVLSSEVSSLLPEYATLRAMGYPEGYLARVVLQQALALALGGFVPGLVCSQIMYVVTAAGAGIPIRFDLFTFFSVLGLSLLMCTISALLAMRKCLRADPADLF
jgi:putative ABC transport system permease protein